MSRKIISSLICCFLLAVVCFFTPFAFAQVQPQQSINSTSISSQTPTVSNNNSSIQASTPDWTITLITIITDPSVAYILFLLGVYGLLFEFAHPGFGLPGLLGGIAFFAALYVFSQLPINYIGFSLFILGLLLLIAESFLSTFGILAFIGTVAFIIGSVFFMNSPAHIDIFIIITMAIINAIFFVGIIGMVIRARAKKIVSGKEAFSGMEGIALENFEKEGWVLVHGERWQAISTSPIKQHQTIRVKAVKGLKLIIEGTNHLKGEGS